MRVHPLLDADARAMAAEVATVAQEAIATLGNPSIAILVRGRPSLPPILKALRDAGIEYRGVELESLLDRPAIRDLVALLRAMLHDGDRTAWLAVLRAPWCGLGLADLLLLAGGETPATIRERLRDCAMLPAGSAERAGRLSATLDAAIAGRGERSLGGWLKSAWLALDGPATIEDASDLSNAELLFSALDRLELEAGCMPPASAIEAAVEGVMASPVGSDSARVQVMTIHRAKGLEFDVVILPDLQRAARGSERPLLYWTTVATGPGERGIVLASRTDSDEGDGSADALERWMRKLGAEREALELGRLAYVAATRARRRLHLIGTVGVKRTEERARASASAISEPARFPVARAVDAFRACARGAAGGAMLQRTGASTQSRGSRRRPCGAWSRDFVRPEPQPLPLAPVLRISGESEGTIRPEFDWAGAIAQAVGQVVHAELQRMAEQGTREESRRAGGGTLETAASWARHRRRALAGGTGPHPANDDGCRTQRTGGETPRSGRARGSLRARPDRNDRRRRAQPAHRSHLR